VRLAVFTSKYPARVATFFERDIRALLEAGVEVDIFPIYPLDASMWRYSLDILSPDVLPRERVHHIGLAASLREGFPWPPRRVVTFAHDAVAIAASALRFGPGALAKTAYVLPKAWAWARRFPDHYDHVLAYWGNYAASCAYVFHRLTNPRIPFSIWLHAGTDLYFWPVFLRQKLRYADRIIICCDFNRGFIREHYADIAPEIADRIQLSYHGLDLSHFPYESAGRPPRRLLAVGRFAEDKGFDYLLRAVADLSRRGTAVELDLVGDGPEATKLKSLAQQLGIGERVHWHGWVHFTAVHAAMRQATLLVHPSAGLGDGLPNVIREAMALGTPVIASNVAGIAEALDDGRCGVLVPTKRVDALAAAIAGLVDDEPRRRALAERARRRVEEKFDLWKNGARLAELLRTTRRVARGHEVVPVPMSGMSG
jgi:colanic acid/amylovoran biosynthesis glycosyltransferase